MELPLAEYHKQTTYLSILCWLYRLPWDPLALFMHKDCISPFQSALTIDPFSVISLTKPWALSFKLVITPKFPGRLLHPRLLLQSSCFTCYTQPPLQHPNIIPILWLFLWCVLQEEHMRHFYLGHILPNLFWTLHNIALGLYHLYWKSLMYPF